jgi:hypothetical protein
MAASSLAPRLADIIEAIEHIRSEMAGVTIVAFEADWRQRWLVAVADALSGRSHWAPSRAAVARDMCVPPHGTI